MQAGNLQIQRNHQLRPAGWTIKQKSCEIASSKIWIYSMLKDEKGQKRLVIDIQLN